MLCAGELIKVPLELRLCQLGSTWFDAISNKMPECEWHNNDVVNRFVDKQTLLAARISIFEFFNINFI